MTNSEFDTQFDIFYNNIASNAAPSVNAYEKSVFLTEAQKQIIIDIYNGSIPNGISFESTEEARRYLSNLVKTESIDISDMEKLLKLPEELWFITLEECHFRNFEVCQNNKPIKVVPVTQDTLHETLNNPFRGPSERRVLRVDLDGGVKLYSKYDIDKYVIYYLEKPSPIILEDLKKSDVTIEGQSGISKSNVHPILHMAILERAVNLAKAAYVGK